MRKIPQPVKFIISSLIATVVDIVLFVLIDKTCTGLGMGLKITIWTATILARIGDTIVNFIINKLWCFESKKNPAKETVMFVALVVVRTLISGKAVASLIAMNLTFPEALAGFSHIILKLAVDSVLFILSFTVQKFIIFKNQSPEPEQQDSSESESSLEA